MTSLRKPIQTEGTIILTGGFANQLLHRDRTISASRMVVEISRYVSSVAFRSIGNTGHGDSTDGTKCHSNGQSDLVLA